MASTNLQQGIMAIQQHNDMAQGKRLIKIALRKDQLTQPERVSALLWLAETDTSPQFKVEQYREAIRLDPSNQDVMNRLQYWTQQLNASNTPSQGMSPVNPTQDMNFNQQGQQNQQFNQQPFQQGFTPSQGMPPVDPTQGLNFNQGQQNQQFNQQQQQNQSFNQQPFQQGLTPSQGMPPADPNQGFNFNQRRQNQQFDRQGQNQRFNQQQQNQQFGAQQSFQQGFTPSQGMPPLNTGLGGFTPSQGVQAVSNQPFNMPQQQAYQQQPQIHLSQVQRTVGIVRGGARTGTGFFVSRDGLVATTRQIIGGEREVGIALLDGRQVVGTVVRSFPEMDLAIIQTNVTLDHLLPVSQASVIPDDMPITAVTHAGEGLRSTKRRTVNELAQHWFPTLINRLKDAGGNPIFDVNNTVIGMLTANKQRSNGYYYGLHIEKIYQCVSIYVHEKGQLQGQNTIYCHSCGVISRAPSFGGFFCENCGNTHPYAIEMSRFPQPNLAQLYGEASPRPCPNCGSQAGFYDRECMRCGFSL
ncbi:MAG: serine protease [Chloroflexota bacterium]